MTAKTHPQTKTPLPPAKSNATELVLNNEIAQSDVFFYPGEPLKRDEIRVTLMGTGWGSVIRPPQKSASIFIELGNGESFVFDAGSGCGINYNVMQVPFEKMNKIFLTHLHRITAASFRGYTRSAPQETRRSRYGDLPESISKVWNTKSAQRRVSRMASSTSLTGTR